MATAPGMTRLWEARSKKWLGRARGSFWRKVRWAGWWMVCRRRKGRFRYWRARRWRLITCRRCCEVEPKRIRVHRRDCGGIHGGDDLAGGVSALGRLRSPQQVANSDRGAIGDVRNGNANEAEGLCRRGQGAT